MNWPMVNHIGKLVKNIPLKPAGRTDNFWNGHLNIKGIIIMCMFIGMTLFTRETLMSAYFVMSGLLKKI